MSSELTMSISQFKDTIFPTIIFFWIFNFYLFLFLCYCEETFRQWVFAINYNIFMICCKVLVLGTPFWVTKYCENSNETIFTVNFIA